MASNKYSTFEERVRWLVAHREEWDYPDGIRRGKVLVEHMRRDGLVAKTTYWCDVRMAPEFEAAKKKLVEASHGQ